MNKSQNKYKVKPKRITVRTIDGSTLMGTINIGKEDRVSDVFTQKDMTFVVLFEAVTAEGTGKTFFINKNHIVWVEPED